MKQKCNILDVHLARGGGAVAGPQGLGILVGSDPRLTPSGWIFVNLQSPPPNTQDVLDALSSGRDDWPDADEQFEKFRRSEKAQIPAGQKKSAGRETYKSKRAAKRIGKLTDGIRHRHRKRKD